MVSQKQCVRTRPSAVRSLVASLMFGLNVVLCAALVHAAQDQTEPVLGRKITVREGPGPLSPPAIRFDRTGTLHVAWFEKKGAAGDVKTVRVAPDGGEVSLVVRVNPEGGGPEALHQAPGLATGPDAELYVTWSVPNRTPGALFASDLLLARSTDGGRTFERPVLVNDDGQPISHTFEDVLADGDGRVYVAWLDGRVKSKSGASAVFACSHDRGATVGNNIVIDGMACPCCRPTASLAPDGTLWVAWRKTFPGNVRDIVVASSTDKGATFSQPILVRKDGWVFDACPHRGPSIAFDRQGRMYVGWYTEGMDEQPRIYLATSDDRGQTFSEPVSLHTSATALPDQLRMAVHPDGAVIAVWEEVTGVRKRVVMRVSEDRGRTFGPVVTLSEGAKAEHPAVAVHDDGRLAVSWTEHAFPDNRIVVRQGRLPVKKAKQPS
ncbi:MAG: sialidase family protein [Nitrospirota bacterium]